MLTAAKPETPLAPPPIHVFEANGFGFSFSNLAQNSHRGYRLSTAVPHQGFEPVISNTATSFGTLAYDFRVRPRSTGKERDSETGLDFFGARYFSSAQGRFTSVDPEVIPRDITNPQAWNKYAYTLNNPLSNVDPDGRAALPARVQQLLERYAPTAAGMLSKSVNRVDMVTAAMDYERRLGLMPAMLIPGEGSSPAEIDQGRRVAAMTNNDVILVKDGNNQAFDGFQVQGSVFSPQGLIPTELKGLTSANPLRVINEVAQTDEKASYFPAQNSGLARSLCPY